METNDATANAEAGTLRYLQIGGDDVGIATVTMDLKTPMPATDFAAELEKLAGAGKPPTGSEWSNGLSAGGKDLAGLHIGVDLQESGRCAFMLRLEPAWREFPGLRFVTGSPFTELNANDPDTGSFLSDFRCYRSDDAEEDLRWASFVCNLTRARQSRLAEKITKLDPQSHNEALRVPFTYNAVDPILGFSPWVLGEHGSPIVTHGGVHPHIANYLVIELEPNSVAPGARS